jgi:hypothetical protein
VAVTRISEIFALDWGSKQTQQEFFSTKIHGCKTLALYEFLLIIYEVYENKSKYFTG